MKTNLPMIKKIIGFFIYTGSSSGFSRKATNTIVSGLVAILFIFSSPAFASQTPNFEKLADAIYRAEGGNRTRHPYGILQHYKVTTPRQACINTIKTNWKKFNKQTKEKDFIFFMSKSYCPVGAANDPTNLNKNWPNNVRRFYGA